MVYINSYIKISVINVYKYIYEKLNCFKRLNQLKRVIKAIKKIVKLMMINKNVKIEEIMEIITMALTMELTKEMKKLLKIMIKKI